MNSRIFRSLSYLHSCSSLLLYRPHVSLLLLLHSVADDAALPRRPEPPPRIHRSSSSTHSFSSSNSKNHYEECRDVKVAVWWDFENCSLPAGVIVFLVAQRITSALRSNGIKGPVTISGFGDIEQLSRTAREALTSTGICLNHVPHDCFLFANTLQVVLALVLVSIERSTNGGKMSLQSCFMADLIYWVSQNPPPVHFFLISGDKDFANILHRLRMNNYNILLASREFTPGVLCSSATLMWSWTRLVKGGNASAKHFNHPPDAFYGSWYGHYKAVLDDPFSDMKQANRKGNDYVELSSESKHRPVPRALVNAIQQILYSYPEGINMSDLRNELKRMNMSVDKDFFGYKNFSHLLASMPNILKFITSPGLDGQPLVVGKHLRTADSSPSRSKTIQDFDSSDGEMSPTPKQDGKTTLIGGIDSISGLDSTSNKNSVDAKSTYQPTEKLKCEDKKTNWKNKFSPSKSFREFGESPATDKTTRHPDMHTGLPDMKQSFFKSIAGWWSGKSEKDQEGVCEPRKEVTTEDNFVHQIETIGVFSKGYFWDALESFLLTSKGAELISKSITSYQVSIRIHRLFHFLTFRTIDNFYSKKMEISPPNEPEFESVHDVSDSQELLEEKECNLPDVSREEWGR
ncbi:hypothetical protein ZIOFF_000549 [Zingiber officinale]|uniref:HTH OST-type domain-containing protein n=1 Tax=Zingiber officinale TaxID=94328 RepID=A0A8J5HXJ0_ZINOF|nr:hypothetical protein ZIOFF_000549 [Zingiber officinale]